MPGGGVAGRSFVRGFLASPLLLWAEVQRPTLTRGEKSSRFFYS